MSMSKDTCKKCHKIRGSLYHGLCGPCALDPFAVIQSRLDELADRLHTVENKVGIEHREEIKK